jgi:hypothetical protein
VDEEQKKPVVVASSTESSRTDGAPGRGGRSGAGSGARDGRGEAQC